jgi:hypothetical protein
MSLALLVFPLLLALLLLLHDVRTVAGRAAQVFLAPLMLLASLMLPVSLLLSSAKQ